LQQFFSEKNEELNISALACPLFKMHKTLCFKNEHLTSGPIVWYLEVQGAMNI
jgi:hypothetical protein